jgi:hypothetical protein
MPEILFNISGLLGILTIVGLFTFFIFSKIKKSLLWTVIVTPLASIIGSGFLIAAPLLYDEFRGWTIAFVLLLNLFALGIGWALRINIIYFDSIQKKLQESRRLKWLVALERSSNWILGFCYMAAIAFYVSILSSFVFEVLHLNSREIIFDGIRIEHFTNLFSSIILGFIGVFGFWNGLHGLEKLEKFAVNLKISVIGGLLVVLVIYFIASLLGLTETSYALDFISLHTRNFQILGGVLLISQGFETVKFMGGHYSGKLRIKAMLIAQLIAAGIYLIFIPLAGPISASFNHITEVTVINIIGKTAFGMAILLSFSAIFSQFGASIADTIGAGGLLEEESQKKFNHQQLYLPITVLAIALLWFFPVFKIITIASRLFALYYLAQTIIAAVISSENRKILQTSVFSIISVGLLFIVLFAIPAH